MSSVSTAARGLVRLTGLIMLVLGGLIWTGGFDVLIPFHVFTGVVLVLALWTIAALAGRAGVSRGLVVLALLWGLLLPVLGLSQTRLLQGDAHWIIQVLHLLVGLAAIAQAENLGRRLAHSAIGATPST